MDIIFKSNKVKRLVMIERFLEDEGVFVEGNLVVKNCTDHEKLLQKLKDNFPKSSFDFSVSKDCVECKVSKARPELDINTKNTAIYEDELEL